MRAEFYREADSKSVVASATWGRGGVKLGPGGDQNEAFRRIFRPIPLMVDDPAFRSPGTSGPVVLQPGTLLWFRSAAQVRGAEEGFQVRFVPEGQDVMGWDPAGAYRPFSESVERKELRGVAARPEDAEAGEERPEGTHGPSAPGTEAAEPGAPPSAAGQRDPTS
ncbi:MAG TPA: hypothetical protein VF660_08605 [Actinomycetota bacterium]|jgi:hypothetical protein